MLDFPSSPTTGQTYSSYTYDGQKWTNTIAPKMVAPPSNNNPLMNGGMVPGLVTQYARGGHVHPSDITRAQPNNQTLTGLTTSQAANFSGGETVTGLITATSDGNLFGYPGGNIDATITEADANILLYVYTPGANWAGIGADASGRVWMRAGYSAGVKVAFGIDQGRNFGFTATPVSATTTPTSENSLKAATTNFVLSNPASGPYLPLTGGTVTGLMYINGDLRTWRGSGNEGVIFLNSAGDRYMHAYTDNNYHLVNAHAYSAAGRLWGTNDFGTPIVNIRLVYVGDQNLPQVEGFHEDYAGSCITGSDGYVSGVTSRYRQFQIQLGNAGWFAVGFA